MKKIIMTVPMLGALLAISLNASAELADMLELAEKSSVWVAMLLTMI
ncbi:MAG: hypothetical protein RBT55_01345 [Rhodocyclaceae bacterium]|nr:hypothetical protein [Rhodocyclaceae bacterium]